LSLPFLLLGSVDIVNLLEQMLGFVEDMSREDIDRELGWQTSSGSIELT